MAQSSGTILGNRQNALKRNTVKLCKNHNKNNYRQNVIIPDVQKNCMESRNDNFRFFWIGVRREQRYRRSRLTPINPYKALSFRALARNLHLKLLDFVVITIGVQKIE